MKAKYLIFFGLFLALIGCNRDDENPQAINGDYMGVFERDRQVAKVELTFNNGMYQGHSESPKFPAICKGTYAISGNSITFSNECFWTAEFDWTLILSGEWEFNLIGSTLILTNSIGDRYALTRQ